MTSTDNRVPASPSLALLALRVEATAAEYSRHLIEHQCQEQRWCSERDDFDFVADTAAYGLMFARQQASAGVA